VDVAGIAQAGGLDNGQTRAAAAVASADRLVIVEGAAGSGKTSMLGVALAVMLDATSHGQQVARDLAGVARVVAPTRRAAQVAKQELGVPAISVAALVYANGWRWNHDSVWHRLTVGEVDPETGNTYTGPPADARLTHGERVIVDEAGMLDQDTAIALLTIIQEAGATIAFVGDRAQLPAVGRGGVLNMAASIRGRTYDMDEVHRFTNPEYAALTLAMRERHNPGQVFDHLAALGLVTLHDSDDEMREHIATTRRDGEAVTVATNEEAATLNERIRAQRVTNGLVDDNVTATGSDGLPIGAGDLIQTRHNNTRLGVANRQIWTVTSVEDDGSAWAREANVTRDAARLVHLPVEYVNQHTHLSYAATAYGVQGITCPTSHTVLSENISAAGVYVGMTRGRQTNTLHIVAETLDEARDLFIEATQRDRADQGLAVATAQAAQAVAGLINPAPTDPEVVAIIDAEKQRLAQMVAQAEATAARWQQGADALTRRAEHHRAQREAQETVVRQAKEHLAQARALATEPLIAQATSAATMLTDVHAAMQTAELKARNTGLFRRKATERAAEQARANYRQTLEQVRQQWGSTPPTNSDPAAWIAQVTTRATEQQPTVSQARKQESQARTSLSALAHQQEQEARYARIQVYGPNARLRTPRRDAAQLAADARHQADDATRTQIRRIEEMPPIEAAHHIEQRTTDRAAARHEAENQAAARTRQLQGSWTNQHPSTPDPQRPGISM
jgi:hypothetical protein